MLNDPFQVHFVMQLGIMYIAGRLLHLVPLSIELV